MLLRFSVQNYLSFKTVQTLELIANTRHKESLDLNAFKTECSLFPRVLKTAAILGPNASGKSNLLKALQTLRALVIRKEVAGPNPMALVKPFHFVENEQQEPVSFDVQLLLDGIPYEYFLSVSNGIVVGESLRMHGGEGKRWRTVFDRVLDKSQTAPAYAYSYGSGFGAGKKTLEARTSPDATFLGTAVLFDIEAVASVYRWFKEQLVVINERASLNELFTIGRMAEDLPFKESVAQLMKAADLGISGIQIQKQKIPAMSVAVNPLKGEAQVKNEDREVVSVTLSHEVDGRSWTLPFEEESLGTRRFLHLAGPLIDLQNKEITLCFDELEASLHPLLLEAVLEMFQRKNPHPAGAQLIFTTHCDSLLDNNTVNPNVTLLRRDQIWFVDKNRQLESSLYCLDEFTVRKAESVRRGYRIGRYKAIPLPFELGE